MGVIQIDWHCECGDGPASHYSRPDGEVCYGWCQQTDHDCNGMGYRPINHTRRPPAFAAMLEALWDVGKDGGERWPKHFTCDLSSDYKTILTLDEGQPFIWVVREMGTHLLTLDRESIGFTEQSCRYFERQSEHVRFYVWNGWNALTRVTSDHIRETVKAAIESQANEDMACMTERQWSNDR